MAEQPTGGSLIGWLSSQAAVRAILRLGDTARMSAEETLRAFYEAFNLHDFDGAIELMAPGVEIHPALGGVLDIESEYRGQEEARRFFGTISEGAHVEVDLEGDH
jgi:hypothetical protein